MTWNPTNANDVRLVVSAVSRDNNGNRTGTSEILSSASVVVDEFSLGTDEDLEGLSGITNAQALGVSRGDIEHEFSFTVQGEDGELLLDVVQDNETQRARELDIQVIYQDYRTVLKSAWCGTRDSSGSSGDSTEHEFGGMARKRRDVMN